MAAASRVSRVREKRGCRRNPLCWPSACSRSGRDEKLVIVAGASPCWSSRCAPGCQGIFRPDPRSDCGYPLGRRNPACPDETVPGTPLKDQLDEAHRMVWWVHHQDLATTFRQPFLQRSGGQLCAQRRSDSVTDRQLGRIWTEWLRGWELHRITAPTWTATRSPSTSQCRCFLSEAARQVRNVVTYADNPAPPETEFDLTCAGGARALCAESLPRLHRLCGLEGAAGRAYQETYGLKIKGHVRDA